MRLDTTNPQMRLYLISAIVLFVGLTSAALIYVTAASPPDSDLIQDFRNSKSYIHDLELYGGKLNVLSDQFRRWFESLWEGKSLAFMIAGISIIIAFCCSLVACRLPREWNSDNGNKDDSNKWTP